jgi:ABC-2 type transport system ATP-binding protein
MPQEVVVTEDLSKTFRVGFFARRVEAVRGVSFSVHEGEIFGLLGPNGAGKTTIMKMLLGFIRPTAGSAMVAGFPAGTPEARRRFGYLPENPALYEFLKGDELLVLLGRLSGLDGRAAKKRSQELLDLVGLTGRGTDRPIRKFSKGMVQRLAIAQSLITDPPIVLFDEPMSGLDPVGRKDIRDLIFSLRERGKTVFFSTHILSDVEAICDRVGIIADGRLTDLGRLSELVDESAREFELVVGGLGESWRLQNAADARSIERDGHLVLHFSSETQVQSAARSALGTGGRIISLTTHRQSLEELFVRRAAEMKANQLARAAAGR